MAWASIKKLVGLFYLDGGNISHDERLNFFQWRVVLESKTKAQNSN